MGGVTRHIRQPLLESEGCTEVENADHKYDEQRQGYRELHDLGSSLIMN
jgi:hypothetical protein